MGARPHTPLLWGEYSLRPKCAGLLRRGQSFLAWRASPLRERRAEERLKCHYLPPAVRRPGGTARLAPRCESPIGCAKAKAALSHEGKPAFTMGKKPRRWECGDNARCPPVSRRTDALSDGALPLPDGAQAHLWACPLAPLFFYHRSFWGVRGVFSKTPLSP